MTFRTIEEARKALAITEANLQQEIVEHPVYQEQVSACYADACKVRDTAKLKLDTVKANRSHEIRKACAAAQEKITESSLLQEVLLAPDVADANIEYLTALHHATEWEGLLAAAKSRGFFLRDLAQLAIAGGYSSATMSEYQEKRAEMQRERGRRPYQSPAAQALGRPTNHEGSST